MQTAKWLNEAVRTDNMTKKEIDIEAAVKKTNQDRKAKVEKKEAKKKKKKRNKKPKMQKLHVSNTSQKK